MKAILIIIYYIITVKTYSKGFNNFIELDKIFQIKDNRERLSSIQNYLKNNFSISSKIYDPSVSALIEALNKNFMLEQAGEVAEWAVLSNNFDRNQKIDLSIACGRIFLKKSDYNRAKSCLNKTFSHQPSVTKIARAYNLIGYIHAKEGNVNEAVNYYERTLALPPNVDLKIYFSIAKSQLSEKLLIDGKYKDSLIEIKKSDSLFDDQNIPVISATNNHIKAKIYYFMGDLISAKEELIKAKGYYEKISEFDKVILEVEFFLLMSKINNTKPNIKEIKQKFKSSWTINPENQYLEQVLTNIESNKKLQNKLECFNNLGHFNSICLTLMLY